MNKTLDPEVFDRLKNYKTLSDNDRDQIVEYINWCNEKLNIATESKGQNDEKRTSN